MARKKQSVRAAEALQQEQERAEKRKRQLEAAKKDAQSDKAAFDPPRPPTPVPNKSDEGPFQPLTRQDLDTVSSWSSDLCGMLVLRLASMQTGEFGMQDGTADRFSSLTLRLVAALCARPAQKLADDLKSSKWDGNVDELESHVERLLGTSEMSKGVLEFMKDAVAASGANAWLLHEIVSTAEAGGMPELPSTLQDEPNPNPDPDPNIHRTPKFILTLTLTLEL